jgi:NAD(P)-dependent dehydrogenase (short-subunit alcohol dehydrogenase family)
MTATVTPGRFAGKTAIVTGAGSGIGKATAERIAREGGRVIASDISSERLDELVAELSEFDVVACAGDVSKEETAQALLQAAGGKVDALANVAGIMDNFVPPAEIEDAVWDKVFAINITAIMRLTRAVLPGMIEAGGGTIVNVSSEAGVRASASGAAYSASKHAVIGFTKSTAFYYSPNGIRANSVAPGAVATAIEAPFASEFGAARLGPYMQVNVPPVATSDELAAAITWLLSDDSANVNGAVVMSDGGWSAI